VARQRDPKKNVRDPLDRKSADFEELMKGLFRGRVKEGRGRPTSKSGEEEMNFLRAKYDRLLETEVTLPRSFP